MSDKDRLEAIKKSHEFGKGEEWDVTTLSEDIDWLIEQAERAQGLERAIEMKSLSVQTRHYVYMGPDDSVSYRLIVENSKLRDALEEIAEETGTPYAQIATAALEGDSE